MGRFIDKIRAKREMKRNPYSVSINSDMVNEMTNNISGSYPRFTQQPSELTVSQDWEKHGFKSQEDMDFWVNRAKNWTDGKLDTIYKVKQFQKENGLVDDGKVGWRTIEAFNKINGKSGRFSGQPQKSNIEPDALPRQLNPDSGTPGSEQIPARNENIIDNSLYVDGFMSNPPEGTINLFGRSSYVPPVNNQNNQNVQPVSNSWFDNIVDFITKRKEYKYNSPYNNQSKNVTSGWANAYRNAGMLRNGGTIKRFQQGGELTPNDVESRLQYYSRIGYPVDGRIGDVNIGTISGEVPYTKYNALTVKGANGMEVGQSNEEAKFIQYIKECIGVQDDNSLKRAIQNLGKKGIQALQQAYKQGIPAQQVRKQLMEQTQYAKRGGCLACQKNGGRFTKPSKPELQKINAKANINQMPVLVNSMKCGGKAGKKMLSKKRK